MLHTKPLLTIPDARRWPASASDDPRHQRLAAMLDSSELGSSDSIRTALVIDDERVLCERYWHGEAMDSCTDTFSMTKSVFITSSFRNAVWSSCGAVANSRSRSRALFATDRRRRKRSCAAAFTAVPA